MIYLSLILFAVAIGLGYMSIITTPLFVTTTEEQAQERKAQRYEWAFWVALVVAVCVAFVA